MSTSYKRKDPAELVFEDNKDHVRRQVDQILALMRRRLLNESLDAMSRDFQEGLSQGEIRKLGPGADEVILIVAEQARQLALEACNE